MYLVLALFLDHNISLDKICRLIINGKYDGQTRNTSDCCLKSPQEKYLFERYCIVLFGILFQEFAYIYKYKA